MAHRRKSSHPVCKTRRNLGVSWETPPDQSSDDEDIRHDLLHVQDRASSISMETRTSKSGQQIVLPSDLYKDFEAVRSQTKMDPTDLMRRLLRDYQSISTLEKSSLSTNTTDDHVDSDLHGNESISKKASIATDVSLATARVDTDEDDFQGLDLTCRTRKITSQLFDTKSLNADLFEKPLDLTCSKPSHVCDGQTRSDSPNSSQMDIAGMTNEFNYVYVCPGLYPAGNGMISQEDLDTVKDGHSPVPELIPPDQISSSDIMSKLHFTGGEGLDASLDINPNFAYNPYMDMGLSKGELSPREIKPPVLSPNLLNFKPEYDIDGYDDVVKKAMHLPKYHERAATPVERGAKQKPKRDTEMKVISENTSLPGVYTSVMKLPWSRRTRTKKSKHKLKLEDTLVPQFMLDQGQNSHVFSTGSPLSNQSQSPRNQTPPSATSNSPVSDTSPVSQQRHPETSQQSCMMVYPNTGGVSSMGKPVRKRGRPPKLPMLAKLLQSQEQAKRARKENKGVSDNASTSQAVPTSFMQDPNTGQLLVSVPQSQTIMSESPQLAGFQPIAGTMVPNMAQAQFIGQFPLSQVASGQIQFLGQFPAHAVQALHGQQIPAFPMQFADSQMQQLIAQFHNAVAASSSSESPVSGGDTKANETSPQTGVPVNYQYAMQPIFIPSSSFAATTAPTSQPIPIAIKPTPEALHLQTKVPEPPQLESSPNHNETPKANGNESEKKPNSLDKRSVESQDSKISKDTLPTTDAFYQEMILSSKSLVDVKKKRRKTAIQHLKDKSLNQDFLCTSFRIRPRLVAQAQAEFERQVAKNDRIGTEISDSKNLICPQNDIAHFGEKDIAGNDVDLTNIVVKQEVTDEELVEKIDSLYDANAFIKTEVESDPEMTTIVQRTNSVKRFMLKGSQKRKARSFRHMIINKANSEPDLNRVEFSDENGDSKLDPDQLFNEQFNCKLCNKLISIDQIEAHSIEHCSAEYLSKCGKCGADYKDITVTDGEVPRCSSCGSSIELFDESVYSRYGHGKIACDECPETFKSLPEFYEHKTETHKVENGISGDFECDFCGKTYQYYHALQFHRRTHRERRIRCLDASCGMKFRSRKEMENHFDLKHPDKKEYYHCIYNGCSKKFLKNFHLQEHIRVKHQNIKAFQCPWPGCIKEFAAQRHLKIHLLIHRDEKPMKCDHCDYRCRQRSAMNWHMRKHPDVPYKYKRAVKSPSMSAAESE